VTSQPYTPPQYETPTEPAADSPAAPDTMSEFDPDLIVLDDDDVEEVTGADEVDHADQVDHTDQVDDAELVDHADEVDDADQVDHADQVDDADQAGHADEASKAVAAVGMNARNEPVLSEQWHDIQAMFVDDPKGSVERAAAAADDAVSALVESLRQRLPAGSADDPGDTEQLRSTLRSYRIFCQRVADLDDELLHAAPMAR
jgi:hypothetical protein